MSIFSTLKSLFGAVDSDSAPSAATAEDSVDYLDYQITPAPIKNGPMYRVAATISKGDKSHQLIRADEMSCRQSCIEISLRKAKEMIDQQGDNIFSRS
ncbi:MAG: HlyU family transcriptional regulator [Motiliproteus sp.]